MKWPEYFANLGNAIDRFKEAIEYKQQNDLIRDAAIQRFKRAINLFPEVLKKILYHEKVEATTPRDVLSKAYQYKFIDDDVIWLKMLDDRNNTSHVYNEEDAKRIFNNLAAYVSVFETIYKALKNKYVS